MQRHFRFDRLSAAFAGGLRAACLALALAATLLFVGIAISPFASGFADKPLKRPGDIALYHAIVERVHAGENYYDAAAAELPAPRLSDAKACSTGERRCRCGCSGVLPTPMIGRVLLALMALAMLFGLVSLARPRWADGPRRPLRAVDGRDRASLHAGRSVRYARAVGRSVDRAIGVGVWDAQKRLGRRDSDSRHWWCASWRRRIACFVACWP